MAFTVRELAEFVAGEVVGDANQPIEAARPLSDAKAGDITFVEDEKYFCDCTLHRPMKLSHFPDNPYQRQNRYPGQRPVNGLYLHRSKTSSLAGAAFSRHSSDRSDSTRASNWQLMSALVLM